jgi:hypothetical protein
MSLEWGAHNENAGSYLKQGKRWPDWEVTTAFYAAAQYIKGTLFPLNHDGKVYSRWTEYLEDAKVPGIGRHELLGRLCNTYLREASVLYRMLRDESNNCRYINYRISSERSCKCWEYFGLIKDVCMGEAKRQQRKDTSSKKK